VNNAYFIKAALNAKRKHQGLAELDAVEFMQLIASKSKLLEIDKSMMSRGLDQEAAVALIVNGFAREVLKQLPMEFAVEAQKLLGISLEGSVG
jgi:hypothetical protein